MISLPVKGYVIPAAVLSSSLRLRENNFDLLRFLFAFVVFLVHAHALSGMTALVVFSKILSLEIAVKSFFVVSGFLIFMSYECSKNTKSYYSKRVRRIYPAYIFVIFICAIFGYVFSVYNLSDYFSLNLLKYIGANLLFLNFLQPNLPGVFESNLIQAVNGALWTLKIEVMFYLFVPLAVWAFRKFGRLKVMVILYTLSVIYTFSMEMLAKKTGVGFYLELQRQLPGQIAFFVAGAAGYYSQQYLKKHALWLVPLAIGMFALQSWLPWVAVQPIALSVLVVCFACIIPSLGNFSKYGDFSYGIYIVHFPILQLMISNAYFKEEPWMLLLVSSALVMAAAFLLWHFIEKPFLRKSSQYVAAA